MCVYMQTTRARLSFMILHVTIYQSGKSRKRAQNVSHSNDVATQDTLHTYIFSLSINHYSVIIRILSSLCHVSLIFSISIKGKTLIHYLTDPTSSLGCVKRTVID